MTGCYTLSGKWQDTKFIYKVVVFLFANGKTKKKKERNFSV